MIVSARISNRELVIRLAHSQNPRLPSAIRKTTVPETMLFYLLTGSLIPKEHLLKSRLDSRLQARIIVSVRISNRESVIQLAHSQNPRLLYAIRKPIVPEAGLFYLLTGSLIPKEHLLKSRLDSRLQTRITGKIMIEQENAVGDNDN